MRNGVWAVIVLCAVAASQARAQSGASTILGGPPPGDIQFKPIDMGNLVVAPSMTGTTQRFNFSSLLRKLTFTGSPTTTGISPLPSPSSFPTYPNAKLVGTPPYQLGDPRAAKYPFKPVPPILNP
jgi:hypothetical protein